MGVKHKAQGTELPGKDSNPSHWINFGKCEWLHTFLTFNSIFIIFTAFFFNLKEKKLPHDQPYYNKTLIDKWLNDRKKKLYGWEESCSHFVHLLQQHFVIMWKNLDTLLKVHFILSGLAQSEIKVACMWLRCKTSLTSPVKVIPNQERSSKEQLW